MCRSHFGEQAGPFSFSIAALAVFPPPPSQSARCSGCGWWFWRVAGLKEWAQQAVRGWWARVCGRVRGWTTQGAVRLE